MSKDNDSFTELEPVQMVQRKISARQLVDRIRKISLNKPLYPSAKSADYIYSLEWSRLGDRKAETLTKEFAFMEWLGGSGGFACFCYEDFLYEHVEDKHERAQIKKERGLFETDDYSIAEKLCSDFMESVSLKVNEVMSSYANRGKENRYSLIRAYKEGLELVMEQLGGSDIFYAMVVCNKINELSDLIEEVEEEERCLKASTLKLVKG